MYRESHAPRKKKVAKQKDELAMFKCIKVENPTNYTRELCRNFTIRDLRFLEKLPIKNQIQKLNELLAYENNDHSTIEDKIPNADSLYLHDVLRTDIYSTGICDLDKLFNYKGFLSGDIIEFCGPTKCGKTILIHTILINILKENKDIEAIYFNTDADYDSSRLFRLATAQGLKKEEVKDIIDRVAAVDIRNMFDLIHNLTVLLDPSGVCSIYKRRFDMNKVKFIVINTITVPFYHCATSIIVGKKITSDLHKTIYRLSKYCGITFFIGNLALHKYKISESDKGDDESSEDSKSFKDAAPLEQVKAALDEYWPEILHYRFVMTALYPKIDILGNAEIPRHLSLVESRHEKCGKSVTLKITDIGIV